MRSDRLVSLLLLLQARGRITAPWAAAELEVSVRTVYRDVEALSAAGVPVWTEQGRGGGIALMPGYRTDLTGLTLAESRALVALTGRAVPDDLGLGSDLACAVRKLIAAVPASHRAAADKARARVLVDHTGWHRPGTSPGGGVGHLELVQEAVWSDRRLHLRYRHSDGVEAAYTLDPFGLVVKAGVWYLVAAHRGRARLWRIDRVLAARLRDEPARLPEDLDLPALWERLRADVERPREPVSVRLHVRAEAVPLLLRVTASQRSDADLGAYPPDSDSDSNLDPNHDPNPDPESDLDPDPTPDGWVPLTLTFRAPGAAVGSLLGFGDAVEVLRPAQVRDGMIAAARAVLARHGA